MVYRVEQDPRVESGPHSRLDWSQASRAEDGGERRGRESSSREKRAPACSQDWTRAGELGSASHNDSPRAVLCFLQTMG